MVPESKPAESNAIAQSSQVYLRAIVWTEVAGPVPSRFTGTGREIWETLRNDFTAADLAALANHPSDVSAANHVTTTGGQADQSFADRVAICCHPVRSSRDMRE